jgi:hypothetical protein
METRPAEDRGEETRAQELVDLKRALRGVVRRLEDALDHLGMEAQRLADENSRLAVVVDRLERQLEALPQMFDRELRESTAEPEAAVEKEPRFRPADEGVSLELAAVPGFQALMDIQRGLSALASVADANVLRYQNDEAALELTLGGPVTAREIVEDLQASLGYALVIEDSRPEDRRLRLRFVVQEPD